MPSLSRHLIADPVSGDYPTVSQAIDAAVTAGATASNKYKILVGLGTFTENKVVPPGIRLQGCGGADTRLNGQWEFRGGSGASDLLIDLVTNPSGFKYACRLNADSSSSIILDRCIIQIALDTNDVVTAIECTGTSAGANALVMIRNSWIYPANRIATSAPLAACVPVRITSAQNGPEFYGCHFKTSTGASGLAQATLLLNEQAGGGTIPWGYAYMGHCDWFAVHSGQSPSPAPILMKSLNTSHPGGMLDVACWNYLGIVPPVYSAYSGTPISAGVGGHLCHGKLMNRLAVQAGMEQWYNEVGYDTGDRVPIPPQAKLDHIPTGTDNYPDGTVAYVVP